MPKPTLVIGDCHGHLDRLEALLKQEGIIGECPDCKGTGDYPGLFKDMYNNQGRTQFCLKCQGDGITRTNTDVKVIQLGDLGHFGSEFIPTAGGMYSKGGGTMVPGSPTGDLLCWKAAQNHWVDEVLWGNHDRAVFDSHHSFTGYIEPPLETVRIMEGMLSTGRLRLAAEEHGWLLTHAGLHKAFKYQQDVRRVVKEDPEAFAEWINSLDRKDLNSDGYPSPFAIRDNISIKRGGGASSGGGILWRDATESLYPKFPQIFGHTKGDKIRKYARDGGWSYCVDLGSPNNGRLGGIWLPNERTVEVKI